MTVSEQRRKDLHERLKAVLGRDEADTLMQLLPPVGWGEVVTNAEPATATADLRAGLRSTTVGPRTQHGELGSSGHCAPLGGTGLSDRGRVRTPSGFRVRNTQASINFRRHINRLLAWAVAAIFASVVLAVGITYLLTS